MSRRRLKMGFSLALLCAAVFSARAEAGEKQSLPLTIEQAEELARGNSDEVLARRAAATAALRGADAARASMLPHLSGSATGAYLANPPKGLPLSSLPFWVPYTQTPPAYPNPYNGPFVKYTIPTDAFAAYGDAKSTYFKGNLTFTQPLFAWGKIRAAIDLAVQEAGVADIDARGAVLDAGRQANRAYFSALLSQRSAAVLAELRSLAEQIVRDRQQALDEGLTTREALLSSKADLADVESRILEAQEGTSSAFTALALITGIKDPVIELASDFRERLPSIDEEALKLAAPVSSIAYNEAAARLSQARRKLDLERGSSLFKPDVSFFASLDASGQDIPYSGSSWTSTWAWDLSLGLAIKADFFDGGAARARKGEASARVEAATVALGAAGKAARLEARRAIEAARRAQAALAAAAAQAEWAAEALRNAKSSAAAELISRAELDGASIREATTRLELLGARYNLEEAAADLDRLGERLGLSLDGSIRTEASR